MAPREPGPLQSTSVNRGLLEIRDDPQRLSAFKIRSAGLAFACETCRKRKKKCDRKRPTCSYCIERRLKCEYPAGQSLLTSTQRQRLVDLARKPGHLAELFAMLPYHDALDLLDAIRKEPLPDTKPHSNGDSPSQLMSMSAVTAIPPSLSEHGLLGSLLPATPGSVEMELMVRHPIAYPIHLMLQPHSIPLHQLLKTSGIITPNYHPSAKVPSLEYPYPISSLQKSLDYLGNRDEKCLAPRSDALISQLPKSMTDLLDQIDITSWASLPIPNPTAIQILTLYLHSDYPVLPLFHAELFLQDLVQNRHCFCSRLLVSALLGWACQAYTSIHPTAASWSPAFFHEAKTIWAHFRSDEASTLCNVAALQLMAMTAVTNGQDTLAHEFFTTSLDIGQAMGLFNVLPGSSSATTWLQGYNDWTIAASYTAWGVFNWASVFALHYHTADIKLPPPLPMPGDVEAAVASESDGETSLPVNVEVFRAASKLWRIFLPVIRLYYVTSHVAPTIDFAEGIYHQLLAWADALPVCLVRQSNSGHAVMMLHVYYHAVVTDTFRPFIHLSPWQAQLQTFETKPASAHAVYRASTEQMKRLLLLYRLQFRLARASVLWQTCLIYVANAAISGSNEDRGELRFYLSLCLAGLEELFASYKVFGSITKGILGMAVRQGVIDHEEVHRVRRELSHIGQRYAAAGQFSVGKADARWIVDLQLSLTDAVGAQGGTLAAQFEQMQVGDNG